MIFCDFDFDFFFSFPRDVVSSAVKRARKGGSGRKTEKKKKIKPSGRNRNLSRLQQGNDGGGTATVVIARALAHARAPVTRTHALAQSSRTAHAQLTRPSAPADPMRRAALAAVVAALACCWPAAVPAGAACLHTARDLQAQARASEVVVKALAMRVWPEPDGLVAGHFAIMAVYKGARTVKNVLRIGGADLFNIHDK